MNIIATDLQYTAKNTPCQCTANSAPFNRGGDLIERLPVLRKIRRISPDRSSLRDLFAQNIKSCPKFKSSSVHRKMRQDSTACAFDK